MTDMLQIGLSGLQAHQRAIEVTSHNIANATTPGYTKQNAELTQNNAQNVAGVGQVGNGVNVDSIRRLANDLVVERLRQAQSESGRLSRLSETLKTSELAFNEPGDNGLSAVINKMFSSFEDLANNPESSALRATVISQLGVFSSSMNQLGSSLSQQRDDLGSAMTGEVAQVNSLSQQIVGLNQQIRDQTITKNSPNDLLDRRDQLVNELSQHLDLRVRIIPSDGSMLIDSNGLMLVGRDFAEQISVGKRADGSTTLLQSNGTQFDAKGGSMGALMSLSDTIIPDLIANVDSVASSMALELNARQSTGTNDSYRASTFTSNYAIDAAHTGDNLDATSQLMSADGQVGMPKAYLPDFTDAQGNAIARNLTINVYDPATQTAQKYIVRYDPNTGSGTRSLDDLVSVINSGRSTAGGGFTLYPPSVGGVANVTARKVAVDGGYKLDLSASGGRSIDFSKALDLQPTTSAWTSAAVTIAGSDPALAGKRVVFQVSGTTLQAFTRNPADGSQVPYGSLNLGPVSGSINSLNLSLVAGAGNYHNGDSFAVDFDNNGVIATGSSTATQSTQWTQGDAAMTVKGRYTGAVTFAPGREWSARVLTPGTIGSSTAAPVVQFTYFTGPADAPVQQQITKVLDNTVPAGSPVEIADGVYVTFAAGTLSTAGNQIAFQVDAEPDQARLLPALGINTLFTGGLASDIQVSSALVKNANLLGTASTRSEGDNSNLRDMSAVRHAKVFNNGSFALDDFYQSTLSTLGVRIDDTKRQQDNQGALATSLENQRQQVSGVSIDEEVTYLIQQQQAYTASARVISTARENVQTLLDIMR